ncbi:MAG: NusG domain II-containing protein [Syntrophomonadaceae bacterium]|nr:NusG domain II-containing protein [Syntrophomonadaceae bacterium]
MKRNDIILTMIIILAVIATWGCLKWHPGRAENTHCIATITQNHKLIERIDLNTVSEAREIILPGKYHEIIQVEKGRIRFKEANCPDKICVKAGWLEKPGDIAVCLPNKAVIKIED